MAALNVTHSYAVNSNILALRIETGKITRGGQRRYRPQSSDKVNENTRMVKRDGEFIGRLLDDNQTLRYFDKLEGEELDTDWAAQLSNYTVNGARPKNVFIKSKPADSARTGPWEFKFPMEHTVYLELDQPMREGQSYALDFAGDELADTSFTYSPDKVRSEAVHVSHVGFHPDDPGKVAFLSTWMGTEGKGVKYQPGQTFWLLDSAGRKVHEGKITLSRANGEPEDFRGRNYNGTDVYMADFSSFKKPGQYRVAVDGVGTSFEFKIGQNAWEDAFQVSMEGLYAHRSGIALKPEFSEYTAPRSFHPDDGVKVYQSTAQFRYTDIGMGDQPTFKVLKEGATDEVLPQAWGGWKDAGDWDRNTAHMKVIREMLELGEMFPDYFKKVNLTIPESKNKLADVIDEALWGLDFFKRMQREDGGVRGGIESEKHPKDLEASWQESYKVMAYAPDAWTSFTYAGVAARAAYMLQDIDPARAKGYRDSALKAMEWAEKEQKVRPDRDWRVLSERNLAAAELYRLTGDDRWHQMFLADTSLKKAGVDAFRHKEHDHRNAAFVYARTNQSTVDKQVKTNALAAIQQAGDDQIKAIDKAGFKWSKNPYVMVGWGAHDGFADRIDAIRAHFTTGEEKYLRGVVMASQFMSGANPDNMSYTTGIGPRYPDNPLFVDSLATGKAAPKGISIYGPVDLRSMDHWAVDLFRRSTSPDPKAWPTTEGFFDVAKYVPSAEYTIMETISPTAYSMGYLAANSAGAKKGGPIKPTNPLPEPEPVDPDPTNPGPTQPENPTPENPGGENPSPENPTDPGPTNPGPISPPENPAPGFIQYEAEKLDRRNYRLKYDTAASGNKYASLAGSGRWVGRAKGRFDGPAGRYKVTVGYFDDADGQAEGRVVVAGKRVDFKFDKDLGGNHPSKENHVTLVTHESIVLRPGQRFAMRSKKNGDDYGAYDYIRFDPVDAEPKAMPGGVSADVVETSEDATAVTQASIDQSIQQSLLQSVTDNSTASALSTAEEDFSLLAASATETDSQMLTEGPSIVADASSEEGLLGTGEQMGTPDALLGSQLAVQPLNLDAVTPVSTFV